MPTEGGAVLAFDFGAKRIGVAVGDRAVSIAHPLGTINFPDNRRRLEAVARLIAEWRPVRLVVGIPSDESADHAIADQVRRFAQRLTARFGLTVDLVDEHLSSWESSRKLTAAGVPSSAQKPYVDQLAACVILESWFAAQEREATRDAQD